MVDKFKVYYKFTEEQMIDYEDDTQYCFLGITEFTIQKRSLGLMVEADLCQIVDDINNLIFCKFTGKQDINGIDLFQGDRVEFSNSQQWIGSSYKPCGIKLTGKIIYCDDMMTYKINNIQPFDKKNVYLGELLDPVYINSIYDC